MSLGIPKSDLLPKPQQYTKNSGWSPRLERVVVALQGVRVASVEVELELGAPEVLGAA